jgi:hypothetical protein
MFCQIVNHIPPIFAGENFCAYCNFFLGGVRRFETLADDRCSLSFCRMIKNTYEADKNADDDFFKKSVLTLILLTIKKVMSSSAHYSPLLGIGLSNFSPTRSIFGYSHTAPASRPAQIITSHSLQRPTLRLPRRSLQFRTLLHQRLLILRLI